MTRSLRTAISALRLRLGLKRGPAARLKAPPAFWKGTNELGRWTCDKCGNTVVAGGQRVLSFRGIGAFIGPCPWECGAWLNRGFRLIKPGQVRAYRADEWDARQSTA